MRTAAKCFIAVAIAVSTTLAFDASVAVATMIGIFSGLMVGLIAP